MRNIRKHKFFMLPIILALASIVGCRSIEVIIPDKNIHYKYLNVGFDTKIGHLDVTTPEGGRIIVDNLDSNSQAMQVAAKSIDLANSVVKAAP